MDQLLNPTMVEIHDLYQEFERLKKAGEGHEDGRRNALYDQAVDLFVGSVPGFTTEEMINGFNLGTELLQRNIAGMMISEDYFHPDYIAVMKGAVEEDLRDTNHLFIQPLQEHLIRDELVEVLRQSLDSQYPQVRWNSLLAVKEENLRELESEVVKLFDDPDSKIKRHAKRVAKLIRNR